MITVSKEDYLKAILEAEGEGEQVIAARLAHWLSVSAPAVTMALRRLKRDGLVAVRQDGRVQLSAEGRKIARRLAMRHHLIERMLHEVFGMAWYKVHDEAERLEHAVSSDFEAMLSRKLGRGGPCPHGNPPTPEHPDLKRKRGLLLLSGYFVPLALTVLAAELYNILAFHLTLAPASIPPALVACVLWVLVFLQYRQSFKGIFSAKPATQP